MSQHFRSQISVDEQKHRLKILNSLKRKKQVFNEIDKSNIKWYSCGPTVYDVPHLGHARCYIAFDIIRRILADYFGYKIFYVMNITDIDDKIIKRARSNHLYGSFVDKALNGTLNSQDVLVQVREALKRYQEKRKDEKDATKLEMINTVVKTSTDALKNLEQSFIDRNSLADSKEIFEKLRDVIADHQDDLLAHTVTDHGIFKKLTSEYEQLFHEDMRLLNVLPPDALTRVSEYIDEIGAYLKRLESNCFAYRSNGSVYFDTLKFDSDPKHSYAKLVREAFGKNNSIDEGEGELTSKLQESKKSPFDFALWKKSKSGEPSWTTQDYEPGRPGWHIECSVMASHQLGENFDIHSGGCDLKFPHHDNEIAQAEAYYNTGKNWVNYFIHSGHLNISGCKMSKSLKNFITIRQALEEYTARQLRFAFLAHSWPETLDYSPNTMAEALRYEKTFKEFFLTVAYDQLRRSDDNLIEDFSQMIVSDDQKLRKEFSDAKDKIDKALCDNFDTRSTLLFLSALIKECNKRASINLTLLNDITSYISRLLAIFGAGFDELEKEKAKLSKSLKYIEALAQFRSQVRNLSKMGISKTGDPQQSVKQILSLCDKLKEETLPNLGVRLEDKEVDGSSYVVNLMDANEEAFKYIEALARFRSEVRSISEAGDPQHSVKQFMELCDKLRNETLPNLGIGLEDKVVEGAQYLVRIKDT